MCKLRRPQDRSYQLKTDACLSICCSFPVNFPGFPVSSSHHRPLYPWWQVVVGQYLILLCCYALNLLNLDLYQAIKTSINQMHIRSSILLLPSFYSLTSCVILTRLKSDLDLACLSGICCPSCQLFRTSKFASFGVTVGKLRLFLYSCTKAVHHYRKIRNKSQERAIELKPIGMLS